LPGATVEIVGTTTGSYADEDGRYSIVLPKDSTKIEFSYLGYAGLRLTGLSSDADGISYDVELSPKENFNSLSAPVVVTATRATALTPVTYTNVSKQEIQARNLGQDAPYLLKWTPSVVVNSDAGTGTGYTGIWIRGSDPTRTNVTINGIPYNDSESQGVFWVNLPDFSSSADNIQIQRGVGTSTNGAGAFGATIDFNTNQIGEEPKLSVDGSVGSFGTRRGSVNYTSGLLDNGLKIDARYSKTHSDGYIDRATADLDGYYAGLTYVGEGAGAVWKSMSLAGPTTPSGPKKKANPTTTK